MTDALSTSRMRREVADCAALIAACDFYREWMAKGGVDVRKLRRLTHETEEAVQTLATAWRAW